MNIPPQLDLSFLDEEYICHHPDCNVITNHHWDLPCKHGLCIEHVTEYKRCPVCDYPFELAFMEVPDTIQPQMKRMVSKLIEGYSPNSPHKRKLENDLKTAKRINHENEATIAKLRKQVTQHKRMEQLLIARIHGYEETLSIVLNRQSSLLEQCQELSPKKHKVSSLTFPSGRESPIMVSDG